MRIKPTSPPPMYIVSSRTYVAIPEPEIVGEPHARLVSVLRYGMAQDCLRPPLAAAARLVPAPPAVIASATDQKQNQQNYQDEHHG